MKEWKAEMLAVSRAGHDKDTLYLVIDSDENYFWLADGKRRLLEKPKKKKRRHVQVVKHLPEEILNQMQCITMDAHVRKLLKDYRNMQNSSECSE